MRFGKRMWFTKQEVMDFIKDFYKKVPDLEALNKFTYDLTRRQVTSLDSLLDHINRNTGFGNAFYNFYAELYRMI